MDDYDECKTCNHYDKNEGICGVFECYGIDCPVLPCEGRKSEES